MMQVAAENQFVVDFERVSETAENRAPAWLRAVRSAAIARFEALGFPTTRDEEWKFTNVAPIAEARFELADDDLTESGARVLESVRFGSQASAELVFVNGRYRSDLSTMGSLPPGLVAGDVASMLATAPQTLERRLTSLATFETHAFTALNTAFLTDGALLSVPPQVVLEAPLHLIFLAAGRQRHTVSHPRVLLIAGEHSQVRVIESYVGAGDRPYLTNAVTEVLVGRHAVVDHYKVQREGDRGFHVAGMYVRGERNSSFSSHSLSFGGALVRNDVVALLAGEGIDCTLNGLYLSRDRQLVDNHTTIDHASPHCDSHELYKGILGGQSRAVFNGKIIVRPDAQKTDAKQTNKALLLTDEAQINTKPQLEIFANDVKCTHGAAIGQIDDDALFYLRARGIGYHDARTLLIHAFAGDVLHRMKLETLRTRVEGWLLAELPA